MRDSGKRDDRPVFALVTCECAFEIWLSRIFAPALRHFCAHPNVKTSRTLELDMLVFKMVVATIVILVRLLFGKEQYKVLLYACCCRQGKLESGSDKRGRSPPPYSQSHSSPRS